MSIKNYRKEIERSVKEALAERSESSDESQSDPEYLRGVISNKKTAARTRAESLGHLIQVEGPEVTPETALECLANPDESPIVRRAALELLQHQQIFNSVAAEWRPRYLDGLRTALEEPKLRKQALEILSLQKDRKTQELLLEGIRNPKKALVPTPDALRLVSSDVHSDVLEVARTLATDKQSKKDKAVFQQALRILGSDPKSVGRLEEVLGSDAHSLDSRKLAASALSHLSPESLNPVTPQGLSAAKKSPRRKDALSRHIETLRRIQE